MWRLLAVISILVFLPVSAVAGVDVGDKPTLALTSVEGEDIRLEDYRGKVVVVDFWATWCQPCHASFGFWSEVVRTHDDVVFLAVAVDDSSRVQEFLGDNPQPFDVLLDKNQSVFKRFSPPSMPTAYILDRQGVVREIHRGFRDAHRVELLNILESLVGPAKEL